MSKKLILVVEDDSTIRKFICTALITQDYEVIESSNGKEAVQSAIAKSPDVMLLDLGLEDMDGIDVIKTIRQISDLPIIVVSAREQDREKVEAFDTGADDYITKPFSIVELLARVRVALRHKENKAVDVGILEEQREDSFSVGELFIDYNKRKVTVRGENVHLTPIEYNILSLLAKNHGKVLTHNYIIKKIWEE